MHTLDLLGTFAFAFFGAHKALAKHFNAYGVVICAALTALGGGTIREIVLRHTPAYFTHHIYLYVTLAGALLASLLYELSKPRQYILIIDAIGLSAFACIGAQKAELAGLGLPGMVCFAVLTAAGGGILTDIVTGNRPTALVGDLYILPAAIVAVLYFLLLKAHYPTFVINGAVLPIAFFMRVGWLVYTRKLVLSKSITLYYRQFARTFSSAE